MTTPTPAVQAAIDAVRDDFAGHPVEVVPDGAGGAYVVVDGVHLGGQYTPPTTWLGFQINAAYPRSDVYPHYIGRIARHDGGSLGEAVTDTEWRGRPALQLSRRSNHWNPAVDNAALKAEKVITWFAAK
ncbi:hypothetical protein FHX81_6957 [Saccharothrix saharensis]|uniref:E2/UBC family protein E n=1 Tax=Saccharothrix saharensis TaxID=571190 RepID=A0A543JNT9_9PSEU|nr:hypothetical protein [Saccharothrix saharensis]TQM84509.1 hypothetical protein FHX81_6957 [Saccharothrix saharensis]